MNGEVEQFFQAWERAQSRLKTAAPEAARGFGGLFQATMTEGALGVREKELIATAIALAERCAPCMNLHVKKCLEVGSTREQILEAAGVAVMMRGGPVFTHVPEIIEALDDLGRDR